MDDRMQNQTSNDFREAAGKAVDSAKKQASQAVDTAKHQAAHAVDVAQDAAMSTIGDLESQIRKNPTQSALIAAGIGLVVGMLLAR